MCALVARGAEQFGTHTREEISTWDDAYIINVILRSGDEAMAKRGVYWPVPNIGCEVEDRFANGGSFTDMFADVYQKRGCSDEEIAARWQEYCEDNPGLDMDDEEEPARQGPSASMEVLNQWRQIAR